MAIRYLYEVVLEDGATGFYNGSKRGICSSYDDAHSYREGETLQAEETIKKFFGDKLVSMRAVLDPCERTRPAQRIFLTIC